MKHVKKEITEDYESWYFCPLCMTIHEFTVTCRESLDEKFTNSLLLEFKEINDKEEKDARQEILSKNQMKLTSETLEEMKWNNGVE